VCRRAERGVWKLESKEGKVRNLIPKYLNRLSDLLWLLERSSDAKKTKSGKIRKS